MGWAGMINKYIILHGLMYMKVDMSSELVSQFSLVLSQYGNSLILWRKFF